MAGKIITSDGQQATKERVRSRIFYGGQSSHSTKEDGVVYSMCGWIKRSEASAFEKQCLLHFREKL